MAIYRAQCGFALDSALPRDIITLNPHYNGDAPQALADALKTNLLANVHVGAAVPFTIKIYDALKAPPSFPLATATNGTGFSTSTCPREQALCLSYYAGVNQPRRRGRLFLPGTFVAAGASLRPTAGQITNGMSFGGTFGRNLPTGHNWVVWSTVDRIAYNVTNYWVDDEWDTVRSRGLRATSRQTATIP